MSESSCSACTFLGLLSALAAAAEFPEALKQLCRQQKLAADGRYDIQLFHPVTEQWKLLTISDALPVHGGKLRYCDLSSDGEVCGVFSPASSHLPLHTCLFAPASLPQVWPCLFEKAVAKLFGGYGQLEGNNSLIALK